jgi:uncharacterized membrane protein YoaK (UPF0700 family)
MEVLERIIKGIIVGAFIYAISFFCFTVFGTYLINRKLDFSGEWGGNFVLTAISFIIGAIVGAIIGGVQPKIKTTIIVSSIIAVIFLLMVTPPLYNSYLRYLLEENKYWQTFAEIFIWGK